MAGMPRIQAVRTAYTLSGRAQLLSPLPLYTREDARMLGLRLEAPRWHRVRKGVHVDKKQYLALNDWQKYAVCVHAYLRLHPDAILCLESAGVIHGLPQFGEGRFIHVYDPRAMASQRYGDIRVHTSRDPRRVVRIGATLVTSLLDTVVDLARVMNPADALAVADASISAVQGGSLHLDALIERGRELEDPRGRARMRWVWGHANALSESPAESISRAVIMWSGYEMPELQREFRYEGHVDRCDFYFRSNGAIGEADGWGKYELDDPAEAARRLRDEKRREDRLRRHQHPIGRWDLGDAWKVSPLRAALDGAGVRMVRPPVPAMLATLRVRARAKPWRPTPGETDPAA